MTNDKHVKPLQSLHVGRSFRDPTISSQNKVVKKTQSPCTKQVASDFKTPQQPTTGVCQSDTAWSARSSVGPPPTPPTPCPTAAKGSTSVRAPMLEGSDDAHAKDADTQVDNDFDEADVDAMLLVQNEENNAPVNSADTVVGDV